MSLKPIRGGRSRRAPKRTGLEHLISVHYLPFFDGSALPRRS